MFIWFKVFLRGMRNEAAPFTESVKSVNNFVDFNCIKR